MEIPLVETKREHAKAMTEAETEITLS